MFNDYPREIQEIHRQFSRRGLRPTFTRFGADWSSFEMVVLWDHVLADEQQAGHVRDYVEGGGTVLANYCLGYLTREGRRTACPIPLGLIDVFGCTVRDGFMTDADGPGIVWGDAVIRPDTRACTLSPEGGEVLATWRGWAGQHDAGW